MATQSVELGTVYLVDLVGSTQLASTLGPAATEAVRQEFFALQRKAIEATGGDEFKNTGDGLMVAFTSASAAIACAVLTQQLFERRNRTAEVPLHLRIGLGTGESTRRDGDYFGMPATEAARLCDRAPTDGILVSSLTKALAGRADGVRLEPFGALELKGIPEPVETFTVAWEPLDPEQPVEGSTRWPLPDALRVAPRFRYVGRVAERERIDAAIAQAREGARQITMLAGAPGIGKTRLAIHAALHAGADGFAVCWGACSEELTAPYEPWIAICTTLVEHLDDEVLDGHLARAGGEIGRIAPNLARRRPDAPAPQASDPETERLLLFNAVAGLLRAAAESVPLCVVLDDFQWADGQSLALLGHVARTVEQGALQILVTYRDSDIGRGHPLEAALADLRRVEGVQRLTLDGLRTEEVGELMRAVAGHDLDADGLSLSAELAAETGGNPFFVGELLRSLSEAGTLVQDETGGWRVDRDALRHPPASVREVIERRVDRLGDEVHTILTAAAVIGRVFDLAVLVSLVDADEERVLDALDAAVGASLVREAADVLGRFSFEHALINHTLYEGLGATRRARVHHRIAQTLEAQLGEDPGPRIGELATHWDMAGGADPAKAIAYACRAGEHALRELAPDEARRRFERGLDLLGDRDEPARRCDLLIGLGEAARRGGDPAHRDLLLQASQLACALRDGPRAAAAALANTRGQTSTMGHLDLDRVAAIEQALELDEDRGRRARLLGILASELLYDTDVQRRLDVAEEALEIARSLDDPQTHCLVLTNWFRVRQTLEGLPERARKVDELLGAIQRCGDSPVAFFAASVARSALIESERFNGVPALSQRMDEIVARLGDPLLTWVNTYCGHACWNLLEGRLGEAERHATDALTLGIELGQPDAHMIFGAQLLPMRIVQGRGEEVLGIVEQTIAANPLLIGFQAAKARILCTLGRAGEAREILEGGRRENFDHVGWEQSRSVTYALFAEAAAEAGDTAAAALLYDRLLPAADSIIWNAANCYGHQRIYLGLLAAALGRHEEADAHFARAVEVQAEAGMLAWEAAARVGWAASLAQRGDRAAATEQATRALTVAREHGYGLFCERAEAILAVGSDAG